MTSTLQVFKTMLHVLTVASIFTLYLGSAYALGTNNKGIKLGGSRLYPKLRTEYFKTDNVFATGVNETDSTGFVINPSLRWEGNDAANEYSILLDSLYTNFNDVEDATDTTDHTVKLGSNLGISRRSNLNLSFSDSNTHEDFTLDLQDDIIPDETKQSLTPESSVLKRRRYAAQFTYGAKAAKGNIVLGLMRREAEFEQASDENNDSSYRYATFEPEISLGVLVSPDTRLIVGASSSDIDYEKSNTDEPLDNIESAIFAGITWDITAKTGGAFRVGRVKRDYESTENDDAETTSLSFSAFWNPKPFTSLKITSNRGFSRDDEINTVNTNIGVSLLQEWSKRFSTEFGARWLNRDREKEIDETSNQLSLDLDYTISERLSINLGGTRTIQSGQATDFNNDIIIDDERSVSEARIKLGYNIYRWLNFNVSATQTTASSTIDELEFEKNWYSIGLTGAL